MLIFKEKTYLKIVKENNILGKLIINTHLYKF